MQKISDSTNTANALGEYSEGNPEAGIQPTLITAAWLNAIQRELSNVLKGFGIALDPKDDQQVLKAVQKAQALASVWEAIGNKPTTLQGFGLKQEVDQALSLKANTGTTLLSYGIKDAFTKVETTSAIQQKIAELVGSSPETLDTLNELAAALGNDPNFATTMTRELSKKANNDAVVQDLAGKANKSEVFLKTETFSQTQVNVLLKLINDQLVTATTTYQGLMRFGTTDEARTMENAQVALSPFTLNQAFRGANQASGVQRLPGGWIIQRGSLAIGSEGTGGGAIVTLSAAYPNSYSVIATFNYSGSRNDNGNFAQVRKNGLTGFTVDNQWVSSGNDIGGTVDWITIGN